jgi:hypothetical protein
MVWYLYIAYFFAGGFIANSVPHLVNGISGKKFPTPFVRPLSSSTLNVWWGFVNFIVGYLLVTCVGTFAMGLTFDSLALMLGVLAISIFNSIVFGKQKIL